MEILQKKSGIKRTLYVIERLPLELRNVDLLTLLLMKAILNLIFKQLFLQKEKKLLSIDEEQMNVEITRGRSDIYDILTHLTFILLNLIKLETGLLMLVKFHAIG
jgi:hypothetical protein